MILEGGEGLRAGKKKKKKRVRYQKYQTRGPRPDPGVFDHNVHLFMLHVSTAHHPCMVHLQAGLLGGLDAPSVMMKDMMNQLLLS